MTQYLLGIYQPEGPIPEPEVLGRIMAELGAINEELKAKGSWIFGNGLTPQSSATVVRAAGDTVLMTDGPFAEAKEFLGGFTIISVEDLDEALHWAGRIARATRLPIEVRAFQTRPNG